jgi:hypothetical protein
MVGTKRPKSRPAIWRRAAVVGRVGSEQIEGMLTTKGLKFCSAATRPRAAAIPASLLPSSPTIESACEVLRFVKSEHFHGRDRQNDLLPHGFAAARRNWMEFPARVAA